MARPVQGLVGSDRIDLEAGESRRVTFDVSATQLASHDRHGTLAVESGDYELRVGHAAEDVRETGAATVTETGDVPRNGRRYFTRTDVDGESVTQVGPGSGAVHRRDVPTVADTTTLFRSGRERHDDE